ncbi:MAG: hypothetical protein ACK40K_05470, partial [Raineya sp.]
DMTDDFYTLDAENYRIIGKNSKKIIAFGDKVQVRVQHVDLLKRTLDLVFASENSDIAKKKTISKTHRSRKRSSK